MFGKFSCKRVVLLHNDQNRHKFKLSYIFFGVFLIMFRHIFFLFKTHKITKGEK